MKKTYFIKFFILVLFTIILISGCTEPTEESSDTDDTPGIYEGEAILGRWFLLTTSSTIPTVDTYLTFKSDGTGYYESGIKGSFTYELSLDRTQILFKSYATGFIDINIMSQYTITETVDSTVLTIQVSKKFEKQ